MRRTLNKEKPILFFILGVSLAISLLMWLHAGGFKTNQTCEDDALFYVVGRNSVNFGFWKNQIALLCSKDSCVVWVCFGPAFFTDSIK